MDWTQSEHRYGPMAVRSDGASATPTLTAGGNTKWTARLPSGGMACSDRGYPIRFATIAAAKKWIEARTQPQRNSRGIRLKNWRKTVG